MNLVISIWTEKNATKSCNTIVFMIIARYLITSVGNFKAYFPVKVKGTNTTSIISYMRLNIRKKKKKKKKQKNKKKTPLIKYQYKTLKYCP